MPKSWSSSRFALIGKWIIFKIKKILMPFFKKSSTLVCSSTHWEHFEHVPQYSNKWRMRFAQK
jgi:hypothetical protein